jgi:alpha-1,3-rhamnosyl/mannosyltransferase
VGDRLRVGVNLLWLVPGVVGGSEEYTTRLLAGLADDDPDDLDLTLFVLRPFVDAYPEIVERFRTKVLPLSGRSKVVRVVAEATWLAWHSRRHRIDVMHHAGGTIPLFRTSPSMLTIHDLQPLVLPDNFSGLKQRYLRWRLGPSARRSIVIATLTEYTLRTIVEQLRVRHDRVTIVAPGYTSALVEEPEGDPRDVYDIDGPFFLFPAITYPHKNHQVLLDAFARVVSARPDALLVLTGGRAQMEDALVAQADALAISPRVRRLGRIERGDLDWLYRNAVAMTFPSRFEGFGLPVLEAMGHACPVIAANATALPEVVGDSGVLVDPDDPEAWADAMLALMGDDERRRWLGEAGLARVVDFRWASSVAQLAAAYRHAGALIRR